MLGAKSIRSDDTVESELGTPTRQKDPSEFAPDPLLYNFNENFFIEI